MNLRIQLLFVISLVSFTSISSFAATSKIKYFGYWGDAMANTGTGNYINDTAAVSNVHYISAPLDQAGLDVWAQKIVQAKGKNNKVTLMLEGGLFD